MKEFIQRKYGKDAVLEINKTSVSVYRTIKVVETPSSDKEISLEQAKVFDSNLKLGDDIKRPIEITNEETLFLLYKSKNPEPIDKTLPSDLLGVTEGALIFAQFMRKTTTDILVFLYNGYKLYVPPYRQVKSETFEPGEIAALRVTDIDVTVRGVELQASRVSSDLVAELIRYTNADLEWGFRIVKVVRSPGFRSKVTVAPEYEEDRKSIIGRLIGEHGRKISQVRALLKGEKVDLIEDSPTSPGLLLKAYQFLDILDVIYNLEFPDLFRNLNYSSKDCMAIVVDDDRIQEAIGSKCSTCSLTGNLINKVIRVYSRSAYDRIVEVAPVGRVEFQFDWMGIEFEEPEVEHYFTYYLSSQGYTSIDSILDWELEEYSRIKYLTGRDKLYLYDLIQLQFSEVYACPECGCELTEGTSICPQCGSEVEW